MASPQAVSTGCCAEAADFPSVQVVEVASGRVLATLPGDSEPVTALAWSPSGRRMYTASRSLQQRAWDVAPLVAAGRQAAEAAAAAGPDTLPGARASW